LQPDERLRCAGRCGPAFRGDPADRRRQPEHGVAADGGRHVRPAGRRARAVRRRGLRCCIAGTVGGAPRRRRQRRRTQRAGRLACAPGPAPGRAAARRRHRGLRGAVSSLPFPPRCDPAALRRLTPRSHHDTTDIPMSKAFIGAKEYFPGIGTIPYEGPGSDNPLAFKTYDAEKKIGGKTMREHLRFAVCYWHTFCNAGADPFGPGTRRFPWENGTAMQAAEAKVDAAFEFFTKLDVPYWCFHDVDMSPDADDIGTYQKNLSHMVG